MIYDWLAHDCSAGNVDAAAAVQANQGPPTATASGGGARPHRTFTVGGRPPFVSETASWNRSSPSGSQWPTAGGIKATPMVDGSPLLHQSSEIRPLRRYYRRRD